MAADVSVKDRRSYDVFGLLAAGSRFVIDYTEDDAVEDFLELHPGAKEADVRAELKREIARHGG